MASESKLPLRIKTPFLMLLPHDLHVLTGSVLALAVFACAVSSSAVVAFAHPFTAIAVICNCLLIALCGIGYSATFDLPLNIVTVSAALLNLIPTAAITFHFCYHFIQAGAAGVQVSCRQRCAYAMQSTLYPTLAALVVPLLAILPLLAVPCLTVSHVAILTLVQSLLNLAHYFLFTPALMVGLSEYLPAACASVAKCFADVCGGCCDTEEDAGSIYYIPTTGRSLDPETLRRFLGLVKYLFFTRVNCF